MLCVVAWLARTAHGGRSTGQLGLRNLAHRRPAQCPCFASVKV